ncbi:MAG: nickel/cobalt transporter [Sulfitobacter sp.]
MRAVIAAVCAAVLVAVFAAWWSGGFDQFAAWAAGYQRGFQNDIALGLRGVRAGQAGAFWGLLAVCFAYGFFHAAGPGHGKVLIGGYGLARRVAMVRLSVISLLASLGQAVTAVALVYGGLWIFGLTREQMAGAAEDVMAPVSYGAIVLIGLWLVLRGLRKFWRSARESGQGHDHAHAHGHDHDHDHDHGAQGHCASCGHKHGPSAADLEAAKSPREALMVIAGIAIRPCTGALFVLVITWQMGIPGAGIAGAFAMALGTAVITIGVGLGAAGLRGGLLSGVAQSGFATRVVPMIEVLGGAAVMLAAGGLLLRAL